MLFVYIKTFQTDMKIKKFFKKVFKNCTNMFHEG